MASPVTNTCNLRLYFKFFFAMARSKGPSIFCHALKITSKEDLKVKSLHVMPFSKEIRGTVTPKFQPKALRE